MHDILELLWTRSSPLPRSVYSGHSKSYCSIFAEKQGWTRAEGTASFDNVKYDLPPPALQFIRADTGVLQGLNARVSMLHGCEILKYSVIDPCFTVYHLRMLTLFMCSYFQIN